MWQVYILQCADKTLYTGITVDLARRLDEHNNSKLGAKYTRARRPVKIVYNCQCRNRAAAAQKESLIKRMPRFKKIELIKRMKKQNPQP